jgi:hypothetical protein
MLKKRALFSAIFTLFCVVNRGFVKPRTDIFILKTRYICTYAIRCVVNLYSAAVVTRDRRIGS